MGRCETYPSSSITGSAFPPPTCHFARPSWGKDIRFTKNPTIEQRIELASAPSSVLIEAFGNQKSEFEWERTTEVGSGSRLYGGTTSGGLAFCNPESALDGADTAPSTSETWVALAGSVRLGWGTPHQMGAFGS